MPKSGADEPRWTYELNDAKSAIIATLRAIDRHTIEGRDGEWVKASDLDAALNASIEAPKERE